MGNLTRISLIMAALVVAVSLIFFISKESKPEPHKVAERMVNMAAIRNLTLERMMRKEERIQFDPKTGLFMRSNSMIYTGMYLDYYSNGRLRAVVNFNEGRLNGYMLTFHRNGRKRDYMHFQSGLKQGTMQRYDAFGALIMQGLFEKDKKTSDWHVYYPNGELRYSALYDNGILLEKKFSDFHAEVRQ